MNGPWDGKWVWGIVWKSDAAAAVMLDDMEAALFLAGAPPAAGPLVLPRADGGGAWPAADARIAAIVQRIVRDLVTQDEVPHVLLGPRQERIDFDEAEPHVPFDHRGAAAIVGLVLANGADPGVIADDGAAERL